MTTKNLPNVTLRPYQRNAVQRMGELQTTFLFDEMGTGKTIQALSAVMEEELFPCLIIPPKFLVLNWYKEILKFWPEEIKPVRFDNGTDFMNTFINKTLQGTSRFYIAWHNNLAATKRNEEIKWILSLPWKSIVIDEAHLFRNETTAKSKGLMSLRNHPAKKFFLTGTPTVNGEADLDALMIAGGYNVPDKASRKGLQRGWRRRLIGTDWIRRTKKQVLPDLPEKTLTDLPLEMSEEQRAKYEELLTALVLELKSGESLEIPVGPSMALSLLMRMRQLTLDPEILGVDSPSIKTDATIQLIENHVTENVEEGDKPNKVAVYSNFQSYFPILQRRLTEKGIRTVIISGQENMNRRRRAEEIFQSDPDVRVILVTMAAGGMGINLTEANLAIVTDEWWNSMRMQQSIDRSHRIGQERKLTAITLQVEGSIDQQIRDIVNKKEITSVELLKGLIETMNERAPQVLRKMFEGLDSKTPQWVDKDFDMSLGDWGY